MGEARSNMLLILILGAASVAFLVAAGGLVLSGWPARLADRVALSIRVLLGASPHRLTPPDLTSGWALPAEEDTTEEPPPSTNARVAFFDCFSGIAGDMALGALVDAGVPLAKIEEGLSTIVGIQGEWKIESERVHRGIGSISGTKVHVWSIYEHPHKFGKVEGASSEHTEKPAIDAEKPATEDHGHSHGGGAHGHSHGAQSTETDKTEHSHGHGHGHGSKDTDETGHGHSHGGEAQRNMAAIEKLIRESQLPLSVQRKTMKVFGELAIAEAAAHGCPISQVHFHEVGAVDSIIDTVGVILGLHILGVTRVAASALPWSTGGVKCQHGLMPVPAPATLRLMQGIPTFACTAIRGEMVTPTGAALLKALVAKGDFGTPPTGFTPIAIGSGAGTKEMTDRPNLVRVVIGTVGEAQAPSVDAGLGGLAIEQLFCFEANIDDMNPQLYAPAMQKLFEAGARDVWITPIVMKKGRPANTLSVLCDAKVQGNVVGALLEHTSTLGVRRTAVDRFSVDRRWESVDTPYGAVKVKLGVRAGELVNAHPEFEDCLQVATTAGVPTQEVFIAAQVAFQAKHVANSQ